MQTFRVCGLLIDLLADYKFPKLTVFCMNPSYACMSLLPKWKNKKTIKERRPVRRGGERGDHRRRRGGEVVGFHQEEPGCCHPQRIWACKKFKIPFFMLLLARLVHTNWPIGTCTLQTEMHGPALWYVHASVAFFWSRAPSFSDFKIMGLTPNSFLLLLPTCCIV